MMNNFLNNLFGKVKNYVDFKKDVCRGDIEMGDMVGFGGEFEVDMIQFFEEVGVIKSEMDKIK